MKTKMRLRYEIAPHVKKEDRFVIRTQYTDGGIILTDDNNGKGYTDKEAELHRLRLQAEGFKARD